MTCPDLAYRDTLCLAHHLKLPCRNDEPVPDHSAVGKFMPKIPSKWPDEMMSETARRCHAGFGTSALKIAADDSTGVATDRYDRRRKREDSQAEENQAKR